ncbi:aminoglycoside phosphotransferase family protein [Marinactinospora thermotolerans]|uniref:Predicted kinase, aminoglycoside phosphotransferase (APT) family n=1 Tax=Marinactinospora thermotolerans DSM 45154 TaxID=1122192 RepID=A0A1T4PC04_9ACTN|nr:aminoglycoside phosphotransferase family protein [Marinactinospora thermotolerans]SJZ89009.1 Predicted kinase, aminoglycoside phosphotransferase (APT) family [Marinactinospora thermotolerans DSM 45154]
MSDEENTSGRPDVSTTLARRLIESQFPQWAGLPLEPVLPGGSDHAIFRLGRDLSVRLPRHAGAISQAEKEYRWLPRLAPHLPLAVPEPVGVGRPDFGYPWPWAVSRWLDGATATVEGLSECADTAIRLAGFLSALQRSLPEEMRRAEAHDGLDAPSLSQRDRSTRADIALTGDVFDAGAMTELWEAALEAPAWDREPVWFHGDFHTGNLLTVGGRLSAVIDFGGLGIGDPACDLIVAFTLMSAESRAVFRSELGVDEATWLRGRGWALSTGLNAYTSYAATHPRVAAQTTRQIVQALAG